MCGMTETRAKAFKKLWRLQRDQVAASIPVIPAESRVGRAPVYSSGWPWSSPGRG